MRFPVLLSFLFPLALSAQVSISGIFNTGVNDTGEVLAAGSQDSHYSISSSDTGASSLYTVGPYEGAWTSDSSSTSSWISPYQDSGEASNIYTTQDTVYYYSLTFSIDTMDNLSAYDIDISGSWASDNESSLYLNGLDAANLIAHSNTNEGSYQTPTTFFLDASLLSPGNNTLTFAVTNDRSNYTWGNPTGLKVAFDTISASAVPEPSTYALIFGTIASLVFFLRSRRQA